MGVCDRWCPCVLALQRSFHTSLHCVIPVESVEILVTSIASAKLACARLPALMHQCRPSPSFFVWIMMWVAIVECPNPLFANQTNTSYIVQYQPQCHPGSRNLLVTIQHVVQGLTTSKPSLLPPGEPVRARITKSISVCIVS